MAVPILPEDELGRKWDRCLTDGLLKFGGGILIGGLSSLVLFKRRKWPVILGSGFGMGLAFGNCEREIRETLSLPVKSPQA